VRLFSKVFAKSLFRWLVSVRSLRSFSYNYRFHFYQSADRQKLIYRTHPDKKRFPEIGKVADLAVQA